MGAKLPPVNCLRERPKFQHSPTGGTVLAFLLTLSSPVFALAWSLKPEDNAKVRKVREDVQLFSNTSKVLGVCLGRLGQERTPGR